MRPLALLAAFVLAAAALPAAPALAQGAVAAQQIPWTASAYLDFGLDLFYPYGLRPTEKRSVDSSAGVEVRVLTVELLLKAGGSFRATVLAYPAGSPVLDPPATIRRELEDEQVVGLHEVSAVHGRAWEYDSLYNGRHVRNHFVIMPRREYLLQAMSDASGAFDPDADHFLRTTMIIP